jgi:hypothetical protein
MAARRLLIVMLILLGISTLAAALVPQHALRSPNATTATTTTTPAPTTTVAGGPSPGYLPPTLITVGGKKVAFPVVSPLHVGDQISLQVRSRFPTQLSIPAFGLVGFATPQAPAMFELIADQPGTFGILFEPSGKVAAQIRVVSPKKPKGKKKTKGR